MAAHIQTPQEGHTEQDLLREGAFMYCASDVVEADVADLHPGQIDNIDLRETGRGGGGGRGASQAVFDTQPLGLDAILDSGFVDLGGSADIGVSGSIDASLDLGISLSDPTQVYLYNTTGQEMTGTSGTLVQTIDESEVVHQAEMVFAGSVAIAIPPQSTDSSSGWCTFPQDATIMTVWPHMHQYGTHMDVVHETAGGDVTLHDAPFNFAEQLNYPIPETQVKAGETVRVRCSYMNTSDSLVTFGDSSNQEMCFAGLYRYPAIFDGTFCDLPF